MTKGRLEAFSDGVMAIIVTIMVLELKSPTSAEPEALRPLLPVLGSYALSFVFAGIYWNNHHHLLHAVHHVDGRVMWANLHFLFWLSLTPFVTSWMGSTSFAPWPVALYGLMLLLCAVAYTILTRSLLAVQDMNKTLAVALGKDHKGLISLLLYCAAIPLAFVSVGGACGLYCVVALMWLIPDRRITRVVTRVSRPNADHG